MIKMKKYNEEIIIEENIIIGKLYGETVISIEKLNDTWYLNTNNVPNKLGDAKHFYKFYIDVINELEKYYKR